MIGAPLTSPLPSRKDRSIRLRTTGPFRSTVFTAKSWSMLLPARSWTTGRRITSYTHYSMTSEGGRSCETQLIEFIDDLSNNLQNNQQTDIMNFAKAFDKVCHSPLTHKLHHYGIQGNVNRWTKNWLANCKQSVVVEGEQSQFVSVEPGVPQGSVLEPCLFLYCINDLPAKLHSSVRLFADDTIDYLVNQESLKALCLDHASSSITSMICQPNSIHMYEFSLMTPLPT